ncbi:hypothetical protein [Arsenicibacter rosenii]|uniref:Uncharacterized protein n=1 Tax=Arsenicibacter rosenii TaxID=1750698 RepID=A0A1S2VEG5_9BACT|nr:hypothetical protein [Arsenicibacter rosenii]OIN57102.1 hypothetical protein BLX24_21335 [Arsenicibacter rosenii]
MGRHDTAAGQKYARQYADLCLPLKQLYENTADKNKQAIDSLSIAIKASRITDADVADRSEKFGLAVAQAIYD